MKPIDFNHLKGVLDRELLFFCRDFYTHHRVTIGFTGGRDDADIVLFNFVMARTQAMFPIGKIIQGDARGYDTLGKLWGMQNRKAVQTLPARWKTLGNAAGPVRNDLMIAALLKEPCPLVIGFPGGSGTADMLMKTDMNNIPYIAVGDMLD